MGTETLHKKRKEVLPFFTPSQMGFKAIRQADYKPSSRSPQRHSSPKTVQSCYGAGYCPKGWRWDLGVGMAATLPGDSE